MTNPLTASTIASIAFTTVVENLAESLTEGTLAQVRENLTTLKFLIRKKFRGNSKAEIALEKARKGSRENIDRVSRYLIILMDGDKAFAEEICTLAQEIQQQINENVMKAKQIQNNHGGTNFYAEGGKVYQANTITINET